MYSLSDLIDERESLSNAKQYACAIRSLSEDHNFKLWKSGIISRYEAIIPLLDAVDPSDAVSVAALQAQRSAYKHEIGLLENYQSTIEHLDKQLSEVNKRINAITKTGNDGRGIVPPREV